LLSLASLIIVFLFITWVSVFITNDAQALLYILVFDIFFVFVVSAIVLAFQPFFVLLRSIILKKASIKMANFKTVYGKPKVIAITGSYGKTSTKEFLTAILSKKYNVLCTKEHQNSEIGIANCILNDLKKEHEIFIVEMGSYNKGGISLLCDIVKPDFGIVTGVNEQHLSLFGTMENLLSAEGGGELANALGKNGILFLNGDNRYCLDLYKRADLPPVGNRRIYGREKGIVDLDIWTEDISITENQISFVTINKRREIGHFKVNVLGGQNVENLLGAILTARELSMSLTQISEACSEIKEEMAGMIKKTGVHGINVIDSSYSSNPDGALADLDYLNIFSQKKVVVMPCLIELGKKSAEVHYKLGKKIGEICDMCIITTKERFNDIKRGAMETGMKERNIIYCEDSKDIYQTITLLCKKDDTVLLEGRVPEKLIKLLTKN